MQRAIADYRRRTVVFKPEIYAAEGDVMARFGAAYAVRRHLPAVMARFAACIRVVGAKADNLTVADRCDRHAAYGGDSHPFLQTVPPDLHAPYYTTIVPLRSNMGLPGLILSGEIVYNSRHHETHYYHLCRSNVRRCVV